MNISKLENEIFHELKQKDLDIITDGIVDENQFLNSKFKIVFLLKEVNGGKDWDLREFLYNGGRSQTWDNIARWTEGILNLEKDIQWSDLEQKNEERRNKYLKKICAVNLKKTPGKHTSNSISINFEANQNTEILRRQLKLYDADIIICCGTGAQYFKYIYDGIDEAWKMTSRGISYLDNGKIIISFSHPAARTKDCFLYYALIDAIREILSLSEI